MPEPIELLTIIAVAKKETAKAVKDALPTIADMVRREVDAKEIKTIADIAATIKGDKGDKGDNGLDGKDGRDGKDGLDGRDGKDGANGKDGTDGKDAIAKDGKDGLDGVNGKDGRNGTNGKDGVGIDEVAIGDDGHLYVGLTSGKIIDAGQARGENGKPGKDGKTIIGGGGGAVLVNNGGGVGGDYTSGPGIVIVGNEIRLSIGTLPEAG